MGSERKQALRLLEVVVVVVAVVFGVLALQRQVHSPQVSVTKGGTLRLATQAVVRIDPAFVSSDQEVAVTNAVYDYLVDVDADNHVQPRLASAWTVSEDGLRYTFELQQGVSFHDGSPFGPQDVVWSFNRLRNPETSSAASLFENVTEVTAVGPYAVRFVLSQNDPFFLFDLSDTARPSSRTARPRPRTSTARARSKWSSSVPKTASSWRPTQATSSPDCPS